MQFSCDRLIHTYCKLTLNKIVFKGFKRPKVPLTVSFLVSGAVI